MPEQLDVFVTVKTYPHPSNTYLETVCTGGLTSDGNWVRLYPLPYRYLADESKFRLYQWIRLQAKKTHPNDDRRPESHRPIWDTIQTLEHVGVDSKTGWQDRCDILLPHVSDSLEELTAKYHSSYTSSGLIRVDRVVDVAVEPDDTDWSQQQRAHMLQMTLLDDTKPFPLKRVPWKFRYRYFCSDTSCQGHFQSVRDWGLHQLYLKECQRLDGEKAAVDSVKRKMWQTIDPDRRMPCFFVGTVYPYDKFIIGGVFAPPLPNVRKSSHRQEALDFS
ncbi:MAG: hypothetical protein ABFE08_11085 [Armatimonadia bacterium]